MSESSAASIRLPRGTVALPALAIGGMSLALAAGFNALGLLGRIERSLIAIPGQQGLSGEPQILPAWIAWSVAAGLAFVLPWLLLQSPASWRRAVLWLTVLALVLCWIPVMGLAAKWCPLAPSLVTVGWSGLCALIYGARHRMPCEGAPNLG
jgi:hypothetical protein